MELVCTLISLVATKFACLGWQVAFAVSTKWQTRVLRWKIGGACLYYTSKSYCSYEVCCVAIKSIACLGRLTGWFGLVWCLL